MKWMIYWNSVTFCIIYCMSVWSEWYTECQYEINKILIDSVNWMINWMSVCSEWLKEYQFKVNDILNISMIWMIY
jgi:hypothetical protein